MTRMWVSREEPDNSSGREDTKVLQVFNGSK